MSSKIDASLASVLIGGVFQFYKYEQIPYNVFRVKPSVTDVSSLSFARSSSALLGFLSNMDVSTISFTSTVAGPSVSSSNLNLYIDALVGSNIVSTLSYTVNIGAGRFLNPPNNTTYSFYKNEPVSNNYNNLFIGSIPINKPLSTVTLPAGLQFVFNDACSYYLTGTPTIQYPTSNYNIIAYDSSSRVINTNVNIGVGAERIVVSTVPASATSTGSIETGISEIFIYGRCPPYPYTGSNIRYTWGSLPSGILFSNSSGTPVSSGVIPIDASSTIKLSGEITNAGMKSLSSSNFTIPLTATRVSAPTISNTLNIGLTFTESVVYDTPVLCNFFVNAPVTNSVTSNRIYGRTVFPSGVPIKSVGEMFPPVGILPPGVQLDFSSNAQYGYFSGTPTTAGNYSFNVEIKNNNDHFTFLAMTINVSDDTINFSNTSPPTDVCSMFIVNRSLSDAKTGYYNSPLTWRASAASGCNVTMRISSDICGTGLTFSGSNGVYTLSGTPTSAKAFTTAVVSADVCATGITLTRNFPFQIINDSFVFPDLSLNLIQNVPMTSITVSAEAISGNRIVWYTSSNLPLGLNVTPTGIINGTPLGSNSGTFQFFVSTATTSGYSSNFPYSITPDSILLLAPQPSYTCNAGDPVSIPITGLSYSGKTVSNYQFLNLPDCGLTINSNTGVISGILGNGDPPSPSFPSGTTAFDVCGSIGQAKGSLPGTFTTVNPTRVTLQFQNTYGTGPTFTSPTQTSYTMYQYMPIVPIVFTAVGTGTVYYFTQTTSLPTGLVWNPTTHTITGKSTDLGEFSFTVYARDDNGVTAITISITTIIPRVVRQQTSAGAYTYLLRQYTEVDAAQNARNNRVYPTEDRSLGKFMAPPAPDNTTQSNCGC